MNMSKTLNKLTARQIETLDKPGRYGDGGNLYLDISKNGNRKWLFIFRINGAKQREAGLGRAGQGGVQLKKARKRAAEFRRLLNEGIDPLEQRHETERLARSREKTFGFCAEEYMKAHAIKWKNP